MEKSDILAVDYTQLEETQSLLKGRFCEILGMYIEDSTASVRGIHEAMASMNLKESTRLAHTLKSSSAKLGFTGMSNVARGLEHAGREALENNAPLAQELILLRTLDDAFDHAMKVATQLKEHAAGGAQLIGGRLPRSATS